MYDNNNSYPTYTTLPEENTNSSQHTDNLYPTQWDGIQSILMIENDLGGLGCMLTMFSFLPQLPNNIMRTANFGKLNHSA